MVISMFNGCCGGCPSPSFIHKTSGIFCGALTLLTPLFPASLIVSLTSFPIRYPCAWQGQSILVLGEVKVNPPYTSECVTALPSASESAIAQVKKVVRIPVVYVLLF
mmetsp:Transcript_46276/g.119260  ORF Transcript_46276/g.119260 Transcript_46276/m.119260 type:complete len:107 (+) Transcript_46276:690-1010(+)